MSHVEKLVGAVQEWAEERPDLKGLLLVGSHARGEARPDSDIDLLILCDNPEELLHKRSWLTLFGRPGRVEKEDYGLVRSLRVHYAEGPEVEFALAPAAWAADPLHAGTREVLASGARVIMDWGGRLTRLVEQAKGEGGGSQA